MDKQMNKKQTQQMNKQTNQHSDQQNNKQQPNNGCQGCRKKQQMSNKLARQTVHENTDEFCN